MQRKAYNEWFRDIIAFHRELEFFVDGHFCGLDEIGCQQLIEQRYPDWHYQKYIDSDGDLLWLETRILSEDKNRIWFVDTEWVYSDTRFYRDAILKLGQISRNSFHPFDPTETWRTYDDARYPTIHLKFRVGEQEHHFWIERSSDYANYGFIEMVNGLVQSGAPKFRLYSHDGDWLVSFLTDEEDRAVRRRGHEGYDAPTLFGIIGHPDTDSRAAPGDGERWLVYDRGVCRYSQGDVSGAWEDWSLAAALGVPELYARVAKENFQKK